MTQKCVIKQVLFGADERKKRLEDKLLNDYGYSPEVISRITDLYKSSLASAGASTTPENIVRLIDAIASARDLNILESKDFCYVALPLTGNDNSRFIEHGTDFESAYKQMMDERKKYLIDDHHAIRECIKNAGLSLYDPAEAPFNPNKGLIGKPSDVYDVDQLMVAASLFFSMTNLLASTGAGMEEKTAIDLAKFPVILTKKGVYVSRMSTGPGKIILLEYENVQRDGKIITDVFAELRKYMPGGGICETHGNTTLGFRNNDEPVCLRGLIEQEIAPDLRYDFSRFQRK